MKVIGESVIIPIRIKHTQMGDKLSTRTSSKVVSKILRMFKKDKN